LGAFGLNIVPDGQGNRGFTWQQAARDLDGLPDGAGLNIAHEAVDRHVQRGTGGRVALRWIAHDGTVTDVDYAGLSRQTNQFANVLSSLGIGKGDRVFTLTGRIPELYVTALGALKNRSVFCPLFSAFGPEPIQTRIAAGRGKLLVTTASLFERKVRGLLPDLPDLDHVLIVGAEQADMGDPRVQSFDALLDAAVPEFAIAPTDPEDMALLHFTSGTTGAPKGAVHVHEAVVVHHATGRIALDLQPGDRYWCTADPGWVTGTSYGIIAPLTNGATLIVDESEFDPGRWYRILQDHHVQVWYTAPTAIRMLMRAGTDLARRYDLSHLRHLASVGEPLSAQAVLWGEEAFGRPFHDTWWQTETGGIMIANAADTPVRPGSMGRPLPGVEAAVVARSPNGRVKQSTEPDVTGELALKAGWPSMFRAYLGQDDLYRNCFADGWYLTGDLVRTDADGYFWFVGRADDVIQSAGHLVGPFEVESGLMEHPAVAEAAVFGKPDSVTMETVAAVVTLKPGFSESPDLRRELIAHARRRLGPTVAPREIHFAADLPKTRSGKIMRRLIRARALGLPEGDRSTEANGGKTIEEASL